MKTITKISVQKNNERYNLFLDEEFFCGVSEDTLIKLGLKKGLQIDEEQLEKLINEEHKNQCLNYAIYLLGRQNYFTKVLVDKLKQKEYSEEAIEYTLEKLHSYRYIDDQRLSEAFVNDKKRFAKKGPKFIANTLRSKGVDSDTIREVLENNYSQDEAYENCLDIARKKVEYYRRKTSDHYTLKGKMYAFLAGRGFSSEVIKKVLDVVLNEQDEEIFD